MKRILLSLGALLALAGLSSASPVLISATPNYLGQGLSRFGQLVNFDDLASQVADANGLWALPAGQYASAGVASITNSPSANPLYAAFFSQQSGPVYLTTGPNTGYAGDITITLNKSVSIIGIGVSSDDTTPVTLNALGANGNVLASFQVKTSAAGATPENGYWAISDTTADIRGIEIISAANLGVDDLQFAPEPSTLTLLGAGAALVCLAALRRRA